MLRTKRRAVHVLLPQPPPPAIPSPAASYYTIPCKRRRRRQQDTICLCGDCADGLFGGRGAGRGETSSLVWLSSNFGASSCGGARLRQKEAAPIAYKRAAARFRRPQNQSNSERTGAQRDEAAC